jgi:hypothetical protein
VRRYLAAAPAENLQFALIRLLKISFCGRRSFCELGKMQRLRTYRRFAARCLEEARGTIDPRLKAFLAEMAQEWQRLAEEAKGEKNERHFRGPEADPGD